MPLWSAHPAQAWWHGESASPAVSMSERQHRVLRMFPRFMHESEFIHDFVEAITDEATSRAGDLMTELLRTQKPSLVTSQFIGLLEEQFSIPTDTTENIETRRGRVFFKSLRHHRTRVVDIATIVRLFLLGTKTYTSVAINDSKNVRVQDVSGFTSGMTIYVGSEEREITSVDRENQILVVDSKITTTAYTLVTDSQVEIIDSPSTYSFFIFLDAGSYDPDITKMVLAIQEVKPAHLDFKIYENPYITYDEIDLNYVGNEYPSAIYDSDDPYDDDEPYEPAAPTVIYDGSPTLWP